MEWLRQVIERNRGSGEEITLSQGSSSHHLVPSPSSLFSHTVLHEQPRAGELFAPVRGVVRSSRRLFSRKRSQWEMSERKQHAFDVGKHARWEGVRRCGRIGAAGAERGFKAWQRGSIRKKTVAISRTKPSMTNLESAISQDPCSGSRIRNISAGYAPPRIELGKQQLIGGGIL